MNIAKDILMGLRALNAKERPSIGLSEIGKCPRQLWYKTHEPEAATVRDLDSELVFEWGNAFERAVVAALLHMGYDLRHTGADQLAVTLGSIPGHLDGLLFHNGRKFVLECKSMSGYGFNMTTREGVQSAQPEYYLQCQAYATACGADGVLFIAGNKENRKRKDEIAWDDVQSIYVEWLPLDSGPAVERVAFVESLLALPEPPARPYDKPVKFPCGYCDFAAHCWNTNKPAASGIPGMDD